MKYELQKFITEAEDDGSITRYTASIGGGWVTVSCEVFEDEDAVISIDIDISISIAQEALEKLGLHVVADTWERIGWREMGNEYSGLGVWCAKLAS